MRGLIVSLYGFQECFVPYVLDGSKTHTIRALRKYPVRPGGRMDLYRKVRQPDEELLFRTPCTDVDSLVIAATRRSGYGIYLGPLVDGLYGEENTDKRESVIREPVRYGLIRLSSDECDQLAWRDGFRAEGVPFAFQLMMRFWSNTHTLPFIGEMPHWDYARRRMDR